MGQSCGSMEEQNANRNVDSEDYIQEVLDQNKVC